jgi:ABC-type lipoprotein export system ATPase subunit
MTTAASVFTQPGPHDAIATTASAALLQEGEIVVLTGASGLGKTTLL